MRRRLDWPERLADELEAAQAKAYSDTYYCALFAADCVLAMTDVDPAAEYRGLDVSEAYRVAGADLRSAVTTALGPEIPLAFARRGDVILRTADDQFAVGICLGANSAFISADGGLAFWPTLDQVTAWRVPF